MNICLHDPRVPQLSFGSSSIVDHRTFSGDSPPPLTMLNFLKYDSSEHSLLNAYIFASLNSCIQKGNLRSSEAEGHFVRTITDLYPNGNYRVLYLVDENIGLGMICSDSWTICVVRGVHYSIETELTPGPYDFLNAKMSQPHTDWGNVKVHQRFYRAVNRIYRDVYSTIQEQNTYGTDNKPLFITGYGRGASMATILAYRLKRIDDIHAQSVYLFGAPRSGDRLGFAEMYRAEALWDRTYRWVNKADLASQTPHFDVEPPFRAENQYGHVGRLNLINQNGDVSMDGENSDYSPGITESSIADHKLENYVQILWDMLDDDDRASSIDMLGGSAISPLFSRC